MGVCGKRNKEKTMLTEEMAQRAISNVLSTSTIRYNMDNLFVFDWESDKLIKTKLGYLYEYEIKISKSDFKNDFKNKERKHAILSGAGKDCRRPNYFYYAVPKGMLEISDIPEYAGLVYINSENLYFPQIVKTAPLLHREKYSDEELNLTEKFYYNMVSWKAKAIEAKISADMSATMLNEELERKGQEKTYSELEKELDEFKDEAGILRKNNNILHDDLRIYRKERRLLIQEVRKYNPSFDVSEIEKAAMEG